MQQSKENEKNSSWIVGCTNSLCFRTKSSPSKSENGYDEAKKQRKPGGWKTMPYIMGNETFERLASMGLTANFMVFLLTRFHLDQVTASNVMSIWSGINSFGPLIGAFIADSYLGRFKTIAFASVASLGGMLTFTLIAWIPQLLPPTCKDVEAQCTGPTSTQFLVLAMALVLLSIGTAGIRPCSTPFGVDQFDASTEKGKRSITSFFNWYYLSFTVVMIFSMTVVVYIQDTVSWVLGFGIPTILMLCSILVFLVGTRLYLYVKPEGSAFTGIAQVIVASWKKRKMKIRDGDQIDRLYYDPPLSGNTVKLPLTNKFRFLNRAALITDGETLADGSNPRPWRLTSIQKVEETKCLLKVMPIWASGIIYFLAIIQSGTFTLSQARKMDRHMGPNFEIPAGSLGVISMLTIAIWIPVYDKLVVPALRRVTKIEGGITTLHRSGIGIIFSILGMVTAGLIERKRRASALAHGGLDGIAPISVFWLAPSQILMGFAEAFFIIGQTEFFNKEFPDNMVSLANSLFSCTTAVASYLSIFVVNVVHNTTGTHRRPDWLTKNINAGRVENLYFVIAALGVLNFVYFIWVARGYQYKSNFRMDDDNDGEKSRFDVEK